MARMRDLTQPPMLASSPGLPEPLRVVRFLLPWNPVEFLAPRIAWALLEATFVISALLLVSGAGRPVVTLDGVGDPETAAAVQVLIGQSAADHRSAESLTAVIPSRYSEVMGYRPVVIDVNGVATLAKPNGTCSSPVHLTFDMEPTCKGHDLGYDLLRYAALIGAPLGEWARPLIDQWWYDEMHARCELRHAGISGITCHAQVMATEVIVDGNSWREGDGPPIEENPWRYLGALVLLPLMLLGARRSRRVRPLHQVGALQSAPGLSGLLL